MHYILQPQAVGRRFGGKIQKWKLRGFSHGNIIFLIKKLNYLAWRHGPGLAWTDHEGIPDGQFKGPDHDRPVGQRDRRAASALGDKLRFAQGERDLHPQNRTFGPFRQKRFRIKVGVAINLVMPQDYAKIKNIESYYNTQIESMPLDVTDLFNWFIEI